MNNSAKIFATYQAAYAVGSLVLLWNAAVNDGKFCVAVLIAMAALSIVAARMLWYERPKGWLLSAIVQGLQSVGFYFPVLAVHLTTGCSLGGHLFFFQKATFADSIFNQTIAGSYLPECVAAVHSTPGLLPTYGFSVNVLAIGLCIFCVRSLRKANQSLEPMARSVTPRADARVAPALTMAHH